MSDAEAARPDCASGRDNVTPVRKFAGAPRVTTVPAPILRNAPLRAAVNHHIILVCAEQVPGPVLRVSATPSPQNAQRIIRFCHEEAVSFS